MSTGIVFDIRRYSIHDGPGIRTAVFFKGCPLHCAWCHNPEGQGFEPELILRPGRCILCAACAGVCPHGAVTRAGDALVTDRARCERCGECVAVCYAEGRQMVGREMTVEQVMSEVERDQPFYEQSGGGVTFTGGEPLAQPDFLLGLLSASRAGGTHAAVDTSGLAAWTVLEAICSQVDLYLYDLKLMDDMRHRAFTGVSNRVILENLRRLSELGSVLVVRIPVIPGVNDDEENLRQCGAFLASLPHAPPVQLLVYHSMAAAKYAGLGVNDPMPDIRPPDPARIHAICGLLRTYDLEVHSS